MEELTNHIKTLVNKHDTWVVENHELRGLIGIASSYLGLAPFDRLNGSFDNDRIVLYTLLVMTPDRELFTTLAKTRAYMFLSLLNDLPGFGSYFAGRKAGNGLSFTRLEQFLSPEVREYAARMSPEAIARYLGQRAPEEAATGNTSSDSLTAKQNSEQNKNANPLQRELSRLSVKDLNAQQTP